MCCIDFCNHGGTRYGIKRANWIGIDSLAIPIRRQLIILTAANSTDRENVTHNLNANGLFKKGARNSTKRYTCCSLSRTCSLQDWSGILKVIFLHTNQISVAWAGTSERSISSQSCEFICRHDIRRHNLLPLWPFGVRYLNSNWSTLALAVAHSAQNNHKVSFKILTCSSAIPQPTTTQIAIDRLSGD